MKCSSCGKEITNVYFLDGKAYGKNCYKMALVVKFQAQEEIKNQEYYNKCCVLVAVAKENVKEIRSESKINFMNSVIEQFEKYTKMTMKQFQCLYDNLKDEYKIDYEYRLIELNDLTERETKRELKKLYKRAFTANLETKLLNKDYFKEILKAEFKNGYVLVKEDKEYLQDIKYLADIKEDAKDGILEIIEVVGF